MENQNNNNEVYGYSLFNDIEDAALQQRNRAVVMANIAETFYDKGEDKISNKGAAIIIQYFDKIPEQMRKSLYDAFVNTMSERGFKLNAI